LKVGLEKLESHEGIAVKALLDSRVTDLFMDTTFAKEKGFKMENLKKSLLVRNVDGMANAGGGYNTPGRVQYILQGTYGKSQNGYVQLREDRVNIGNAVASSPQSRNRLGERRSEDDALPTYMWKKQEVKEKKVRKMEKDEDEKVLKKLVPRRFWKWKKVFGKKESEGCWYKRSGTMP